MPSQQMNLQGFSSAPNILHKHSINSLLEHQDLISRGGLTSTMDGIGEESMSISEILNLSSMSNVFSSNQQTSPASPGPQQYAPLTPNSSNSSMSPGAFNIPSAKTSFDAFQFDNMALNTPLKFIQRNTSFDSSTPMSPTTPTSLNPLRSPKIRDCSSPQTPENPFTYNISSGSNSPDSDYNAFSNPHSSLADLMNYLSINQSQYQQQQQQQQQQQIQSLHNQQQNAYNSMPSNDLHNLQTMNALKLLQQQQQQQQQQLHQAQVNTSKQFNNIGLNQLLQNCAQNQASNWYSQSSQSTNSDLNLDRMAKYHRSSAAISDATSTWSGILPQRSSHAKIVNYSNKVFLGGIPPDITESMFIEIFKLFGPIRVEWPGKEHQSSKPKGYVYIIFESEKQIRSLLSSCSVQDGNACNARKYFYRISGKCLKPQKIEVIPWIISDSNYVKSSSQKLDPCKTVFVGALHGQLTAEGLAKIMDELFEGVIYAGIDTDKHKYPLGSARVTFNNSHSYYKAVAAAFIDVRSSKFKRKVFQIDPYLEDSLCSACGVQHGPYFCREFTCFKYFCRTCWQWQHTTDATIRYHKPMTRNSKSQHLIGIGPQSSSTGFNSQISIYNASQF